MGYYLCCPETTGWELGEILFPGHTMPEALLPLNSSSQSPLRRHTLHLGKEGQII